MNEKAPSQLARASWPALFLDRDGVLVEHRPDYLRRWSDAVIIPGVAAELARLNPSPLRIVIVTNQSAVGRGLITHAQAEAINRALVDEIVAAGGRVDGVYMCPHAPEDGCSCRKPRPGLLLEAARDLSIDLAGSILIGDAESDLQAGRAAGIRRNILVRTGRGRDEAIALSASGNDAVPVYDDLVQALRALFP